MPDIHKRLEALLERFDNMTTPFDETSLQDEIHRLQMEAHEHNEEPFLALQAEAMAFGFGEDSSEDTYYGPKIVMRDESGHFAWPNVQQITPEVIEYWKERCTLVKNPILRGRYADLVWVFAKMVTGNSPDIFFARTAIDDRLTIVNDNLYKFEISAKTKLERALSLSLSINDKSRVEAARDAMIAFEEKIEDGLRGVWGLCFDNLIGNRKVALTPEQEAKIVSALESRLARTSSNEEGFPDPLSAEVAAMRLAGYYRKRGKHEDVKRVLRMYGDACVAASEGVGGAGVSLVQKALEIFHANGMKDEADALAARLEELGEKSLEEMHLVSAKIPFSREEVDSFLAEMTQGTLDEILTRIAFSFHPDVSGIEEQIKELSGKAPLSHIIPKTILDGKGRPAAVIGSLEEDYPGHLVFMLSFYLRSSSVFLRMAMEKLTADGILELDGIMEFLFQSPLFDQDYRETVEIGVDAYLRGNYIVAAHVLVPFIEHTLRRLMRSVGSSIYRPGRHGGLDLRTLGDILRDKGVIEALGDDTVLYLKVLLTDQRGWNLRNVICHGLQGPKSFDLSMADRLMHVLLLLAVV